MIKAVLDTNVLALGILGFVNPQSIPGQGLRLWREGAYQLIVSEWILDELERTLTKPFFTHRLSTADAAAGVKALRERALSVAITRNVEGIASHPEDDRVLATALSADADYLVTGDRALQVLGRHAGIQIASARDFVEVIAAQWEP